MAVQITQYKWEGSWGPFRIKIPCGECSASEGIIEDVIKTEFAGADIQFEVLPWLDNWYKPLLKGGWHAPIVLVNGRLVSQGTFVDRGLLGFYIRRELAKEYRPVGNVLFAKPGCKFCKRAKEALRKAGVEYDEKDIIRDALAPHLLFALLKPVFPANKPISVPQLWLDGKYFGESDDIVAAYERGELARFRNR